MAVPVEPNAEAWADLIQDQGQGQPLVQDQQIQAQEQQPQAPPGGPKFKLASLHVYRVLCQVLPFMCHPFTVVPRSHILLPCIYLTKILVVCST